MILDDPRNEYASRPPRPVKRHFNGQIVGLEDVRIDEESDVQKAILTAYEIIAPVVPNATGLARSAVLGTTWARRMIFWLERATARARERRATLRA